MSSKRQAAIFLILLVLIVGCREEVGNNEPTATIPPPATSTSEAPSATPTIPITPTSTNQPTPLSLAASGSSGSGGRSDVTIYGNVDAGVVFTHPADWRILNQMPLRFGTNPTLLSSPSIAENEATLILYSDQNPNDLLALLPNTVTPSEIITAYMESGQINQYGSEPELLIPAETSLGNGGSRASSAVRLVTADGDIGIVYLTAIRAGRRRALLVALTVASTRESLLREISDVAESIELLDPNGVLLRIGRLPAGNSINHYWSDAPYQFELPAIASAPILLLLESDSPANGAFYVADEEGTIILERNIGGPGEAEIARFVPPSTGIYTITVTNVANFNGNFKLSSYDLRPQAGSVIAVQTSACDPLQPSSFSFSVEPFGTILLFVEPVGDNIQLMDPVVEIVNVTAGTTQQIDNGYQSEAEFVYLQPAGATTYTINVFDFFNEPGCYRTTVVRTDT